MISESFRKTSLTVLVPELIIAPAASLGAIYVFAHTKPMNAAKNFISKHIVEPNLDWFESRSGSLKKAHEEYDRKKREAMEARGEAVPAPNVSVSTRHERADIIAQALAHGALAMTFDLGATLLGQHFIGKHYDQPVKKSIAVFESVVHLGGVVAMAGPGAVQGENMHYWLKHKLENAGVNSSKADDLSTAVPYIVLPGYVASIGSLGLAQLLKNGKNATSHSKT